MNMKLSDEGLTQIAQHEGFAPKMYPDHKGYSIGYGHLLSPAEMPHYTGKTITQDEAKVLLRQDAGKAEIYVNDTIKVSLTQAQFDSLVDFTYNAGVGSLANIALTLNKGDYKAAAARMRLYDKVRVNGQLVQDAGLVARRKQEVQAFA
jgi:GH24 family phage-related lysozyme (muramidase)